MQAQETKTRGAQEDGFLCSPSPPLHTLTETLRAYTKWGGTSAEDTRESLRVTAPSSATPEGQLITGLQPLPTGEEDHTALQTKR